MLYIGIDLGTSAVKLLWGDGPEISRRLFQRNTLCISLIRADLNRIRRTGTGRP